MTDPGDDADPPSRSDDQKWVDEILERARLKADQATPKPNRGPDPAEVADQAEAIPSVIRPPIRPTAPPQLPPDPPIPPSAPPEIPTAATPAPRQTQRVTRADPAAPVRPRRIVDPVEPEATGHPADRIRTLDDLRRQPAPAPQVDEVDDAPEPEPASYDDEVDIWNEGALDIAGDDDFPREEPKANRGLRAAVEWTAVIVGALVVALLIKTFLFQAFYIPSESMEPTLHKNDRVLVNKLSYDLHDVNRGDIIVFEKPPGMSGTVPDLIKRVIALPNETLELSEGQIYIDGQLLLEPYLPEGTLTLPKRVMSGCVGEPSDTRCLVPEDMVLVMGDNRENSTDGRWFGPIETDTIVGRAFIKVFPLGDIGFL